MNADDSSAMMECRPSESLVYDSTLTCLDEPEVGRSVDGVRRQSEAAAD
jgi:hypothetical protein